MKGRPKGRKTDTKEGRNVRKEKKGGEEGREGERKK
jgi:hypothetical protein